MTNLSEFSSQLADTVELAAASLVTVWAARPISGSVVGPDLILTAAHVLSGDEVSVTTPDGRRLSASVVGRDPGSDLALLRAEGLNLPALSAGTPPRVGELLLAVGRPEHGPQAALGLLGRAGLGGGWLPTGATPFPGVSGGALIDARGALVGVLNAGVPRRGLVAVPAARALRVAELLDQTGRVPRGYLGVATQPVLLPGSAPQDTGEQDPQAEGHPGGEGRGPRGPWDRDPGEWGDRARGPWGPGERGGRGPWGERGARGGPWGERGPWGGRGPRAPWAREDGGGRPHGGEGWGRHGRGDARLGLTVVQVEAGSPAAQAGLRLGDILLSLEGEGMRHPRELLARVQGRAGETLTARVLRGGEEQDVALSIGER